MPRYRLDLYQEARINTEQFEVEAKDDKDAKAQADAIALDKGLKRDFDWEIIDLDAQAAEANPQEPEVR